MPAFCAYGWLPLFASTVPVMNVLPYRPRSVFCVSISVSTAVAFSLLKTSSPKPPVIVSPALSLVPPSITSLNGEPISRSSPAPPNSVRATRSTGVVLGIEEVDAVPSRLASIVSAPEPPLIVSVSPSERTVCWT